MVRQSLHTADARGGAELPGEAAGALSEVQEGLSKGSLAAHRQTHHIVTRGGLRKECNKEIGGNDSRTFMMTFAAKSGSRTCPVEG